MSPLTHHPPHWERPVICYILGRDQMPGPAGGGGRGRGARRVWRAEAWRVENKSPSDLGLCLRPAMVLLGRGTGRPGALVGNQVGTLSGGAPLCAFSVYCVTPLPPPQTPGLGAPSSSPSQTLPPDNKVLYFGVLVSYFPGREKERDCVAPWSGGPASRSPSLLFVPPHVSGLHLSANCILIDHLPHPPTHDHDSVHVWVKHLFK